MEVSPLAAALVVSVLGWIVFRLEGICKTTNRIKRVLRLTHPDEYDKAFPNC